MSSSRREIVEELLTEPSRKFTNHLKIENNDRIIFSGMYGAGKTTFLEEYFKRNSKDYNVVYLFPVNYSVLTEEDIIKYISYDILRALMFEIDKDGERYLPLSKIDLQSIAGFTKERITDVMALMLLLIPKIGWPLHNFAKGILKLIDEYKEEREENTELNEYQRVKRELSKFSPDLNLYLNDDITNLIIQILKRKKSTTGKQNVLVIEDLDRIDPHHIFRLFNVFAAHFDTGRDTKNKFGFDKVIFVCDINNIKNIFRSNFGTKTDFNGYVDKFYSKRIFYFNNFQAANEFIDLFVRKFGFDDNTSINIKNFYYQNNKVFGSQLKTVLQILLAENLVNLRTLFRYYSDNSNIPEKKIVLGANKRKVLNYQIEALFTIDILHNIMGDIENLIDVVEILCSRNIRTELNEYNFEFAAVSLLILQQNEKLEFRGSNFTENKKTTVEVNSEKYTFRYNFTSDASYNTYYGKIIEISKNGISQPEPKLTWSIYFSILHKTLLLLKSKRYF